MRKTEIEEGLGELADIAERDHEVQMARADLYKSAKYSIKLHEMLKGVSEAEGLEGWVQAKITKASEMLGSVYHHLDYEESGMADENMVVGESAVEMCPEACCGKPVKECSCGADCKHCNCYETNKKNEGVLGALAGGALGLATGGIGGAVAGGYLGHKIDSSAKNKKKPISKKSKKSPIKKTDKESLQAKLEGKFKSAAHRKAVHAGKASGKKK